MTWQTETHMARVGLVHVKDKPWASSTEISLSNVFRISGKDSVRLGGRDVMGLNQLTVLAIELVRHYEILSVCEIK